MLGKPIFKFTAFGAKGELIEKIEGSAEFSSQVDDIAAADTEMTLVIYLGG